ncbi:UNVERIFIED_CONTAM: hypothetical protein FKN15_060306 [Acipenser sinensis]
MPAESNDPECILSYQRPDEEAVVDQGGTSSVLNIHYEKEELEGHRTLYVGVRMPMERQSHRHHRPHGPKHRKRDRIKGTIQEEGPSHDTPSQRVQFILGTEDDDEEHVPHDLFTELDEICVKQGQNTEWKETARWLKFEEDVEDGGDRWSKPYVATLSLHSLFELRSCLINGTVLLDMRASTIEEIADMVLDQQEASMELDESVRVKVREALLKKHHHQIEKKRNNLLPMVRSFTEAGKKQSEPHSMDKNCQTVPPQAVPTNQEMKNGVHHENSTADLSKEKRKMPGVPNGAISLADPEPHGEHSGPELQRTGRLFGGLFLDVKRKAPFYWSDYRDSLNLQCVASFLFLYCACMSPVITFGGLLGEATEGRISAIESLLGASMTGIAYSLFAGQPLTILGSTGPVLVFEKILFKFCKDFQLSYLSLRTCIGLWTAILCLLLVATDASSLVCYITRFTEEAFASLICLIFIYEAIEKLLHLGELYPINMNSELDKLTLYYCRCSEPDNPSNETLKHWEQNNITASSANWANLTVEKCRSLHGEFVGPSCGHHGPYTPDVLFWSAILFFAPFAMSSFLKQFKPSRYFPTRPTRDDRGWLISPIGPNPWWTVVAAIIPALLCTILIFMDQQITAVIINRKEHKLVKGCGYHLDLLMVGVMLGVCSIMGLPWFVAATVLSISHVNSLKLESECSAPGEQPKFLGIREQRLTGLMIFVLMGCSVFMTGVLQFIPMPVLYGVFLYMGVSSLKGIQFFDRLKLFAMPPKHQPDFIYLRHVPLRKVHLFTIIQLTCLVLLWVIKASPAAIVFPMMVLALVFIRKLMDLGFSKRELSWLDDLMPESKKKKLDDASQRAKEQEESAKMLEAAPEDKPVEIPMESSTLLHSPGKNNNSRCDPSDINISDEMSRTAVWKGLGKNTDGSNLKDVPVSTTRQGHSSIIDFF